jgi:PAS domain S-box-containing protein
MLDEPPGGGQESAVDDGARQVARELSELGQMRYALDQAAIVACTDHRGIITYANDKFCEISKYARTELIGQDHRIVNSGRHPKSFMRELWRTIAKGQVWRGEIQNRAKDGSLYWVDTTIVPFLDDRGKPRQYLAIRSDITARKQVEAQLRAQAALTQLGQLAAVVAHEVRNPLAGVRASLQVLEGRVPAPRDRDVIAAMIARIDGLNAKVDDLLQYARPKAPRLIPVDVAALMAEVAASAQVTSGGAATSIKIAGPNHVKVLADPEMLRAAALNLVMNACQASSGGVVDIQIAADAAVCRIAFLDRGPGLPPSVRAHLFEPFVTTRAAGTGLGLPIVKRLMDLQNGKVEISNRPGGGTVAELSVTVHSAVRER